MTPSSIGHTWAPPRRTVPRHPQPGRNPRPAAAVPDPHQRPAVGNRLRVPAVRPDPLRHGTGALAGPAAVRPASVRARDGDLGGHPGAAGAAPQAPGSCSLGGEEAGLRRLIHPTAGYARVLDESGELGQAFLETARIAAEQGEPGFWLAQAQLHRAIHLLHTAEPVDEETWRVREHAHGRGAGGPQAELVRNVNDPVAAQPRRPPVAARCTMSPPPPACQRINPVTPLHRANRRKPQGRLHPAESGPSSAAPAQGHTGKGPWPPNSASPARFTSPVASVRPPALRHAPSNAPAACNRVRTRNVGNPLLRKGGSQTLRQTFLCLVYCVRFIF